MWRPKLRALPWGRLGVGLAAICYSLGLLVLRLSSLQHSRLSGSEVSASHYSDSFHQLISYPLYLPITLARWIVGKVLPWHNIVTLRLPSVLFAFATVLTVVYLLRHWYGRRTAAYGFVIFASSAWLLHVGRLADFDVAYLWALPTLLAAHSGLYQNPKSRRVIMSWLVISLFVLYIPGLIWFVILNAVWQRRRLAEAWQSLQSWLWRGVVIVVALAGLAPLVYGFVRNPHWSFVLTWLGLPTVLPSWQEPLKAGANSLLFVFIRAPYDPTHWLGHLPMLDAFMAASLLAGMYFYVTHLRAERTRLLASLVILGILLVAAGGAVSLSVIVPLIYLVAAGGIAYLLHMWLRVFPRNPLARRFGIGLVYVAIALSAFYNIRQYYVAWPNHPDTVQAFSQSYQSAVDSSPR